METYEVRVIEFLPILTAMEVVSLNFDRFVTQKRAHCGARLDYHNWSGRCDVCLCRKWNSVNFFILPIPTMVSRLVLPISVV